MTPDQIAEAQRLAREWKPNSNVISLPRCFLALEEIVATATLILIGHAAFHAAVEQYPGARLTLRQGTRVILKRPE